MNKRNQLVSCMVSFMLVLPQNGFAASLLAPAGQGMTGNNVQNVLDGSVLGEWTSLDIIKKGLSDPEPSVVLHIALEIPDQFDNMAVQPLLLINELVACRTSGRFKKEPLVLDAVSRALLYIGVRMNLQGQNRYAVTAFAGMLETDRYGEHYQQNSKYPQAAVIKLLSLGAELYIAKDYNLSAQAFLAAIRGPGNSRKDSAEILCECIPGFHRGIHAEKGKTPGIIADCIKAVLTYAEKSTRIKMLGMLKDMKGVWEVNAVLAETRVKKEVATLLFHKDEEVASAAEAVMSRHASSRDALSLISIGVANTGKDVMERGHKHIAHVLLAVARRILSSGSVQGRELHAFLMAALNKTFEWGNEDVRAASLDFIEKQKEVVDIPLYAEYRRLLYDPSMKVSAAAARVAAAYKIQAEGIEDRLVEMAKSRNEDVAFSALNALRKLETETARKALAKIAGSSWKYPLDKRAYAVKALAMFDRIDFDDALVLIKALNSWDAELSQITVDVYGKVVNVLAIDDTNTEALRIYVRKPLKEIALKAKGDRKKSAIRAYAQVDDDKKVCSLFNEILEDTKTTEDIKKVIVDSLGNRGDQDIMWQVGSILFDRNIKSERLRQKALEHMMRISKQYPEQIELVCSLLVAIHGMNFVSQKTRASARKYAEEIVAFYMANQQQLRAGVLESILSGKSTLEAIKSL